MRLPNLSGKFVYDMDNEETWWFIKWFASGILTVVLGIIVVVIFKVF